MPHASKLQRDAQPAALAAPSRGRRGSRLCGRPLHHLRLWQVQRCSSLALRLRQAEKGLKRAVCSPLQKDGFAIHTYTATASMQRTALCNADGDFLIVPQEGALQALAVSQARDVTAASAHTMTGCREQLWHCGPLHTTAALEQLTTTCTQSTNTCLQARCR